MPVAQLTVTVIPFWRAEHARSLGIRCYRSPSSGDITRSEADCQLNLRDRNFAELPAGVGGVLSDAGAAHLLRDQAGLRARIAIPNPESAGISVVAGWRRRAADANNRT